MRISDWSSDVCSSDLVGQLVHNDDYLRQWVEIELFFLIDRLSGIVIVAGLDATTQRLALCLCGTNLFIEVGEIAVDDRGHHAIAVLTLIDRLSESKHSLARLEARRVEKECFMQCRSRSRAYDIQTTKTQYTENKKT